MTGITLFAILRVPREGIASFQAYEDAVLPLLAAHGGRLERRLRTGDECVEIHLLWFPSSAHLEAYRTDPARAAHAALFAASGAAAEVLAVDDVSP